MEREQGNINQTFFLNFDLISTKTGKQKIKDHAFIPRLLGTWQPNTKKTIQENQTMINVTPRFPDLKISLK